MKKKRSVKVGDVIQFPHHCFSEQRRGWNGWIFRAGIVEKLYKNEYGKPFAVVTYCWRIAGRYQLLPCELRQRRVPIETLFEYDVPSKERNYKEYKAYEDAGEQVCWDEDTALLLDRGIIGGGDEK